MKEKLVAYGVNYDETMERFVHSEAFYLECLGMLLEDPNPGMLRAAIRENHLRTAFEAAHTLKGVTANMGLTPLYISICAIVEPLRTGSPADYGALLDRFFEEFDRVRALFNALCEEDRHE